MITCVVHYNNIALASIRKKMTAKPILKFLRIHRACIAIIPENFIITQTRNNIYANKFLAGNNAVYYMAAQSAAMCSEAKL